MISWRSITVMQITVSAIFSFLMHVPQYFKNPDLACDVYGSNRDDNSTNIGKMNA